MEGSDQMSLTVLFVLLYILLPSLGLSLIMFSFKRHIEHRYRTLFTVLCVLPLLFSILFSYVSISHNELGWLNIPIYYLFLIILIICEICLLSCSPKLKKIEVKR